MAHFGVLSYQGAGHLNPLIALSRELTARGHTVTFFLNPEAEEQIRGRGLGFVAIQCQARSASGAKPAGPIGALHYRLRRTIREMEMFLRETPPALERAQVDALIIDELALAGPTVAEMQRLPYIIVSTSVPHSFGWSVPPLFAPSRRLLERVQSALLEVSVLKVHGPIRRRLNRFRQDAGLTTVGRTACGVPACAHVTQLPKWLDFPRESLPSSFCYAGPFVDPDARASIPFPWERLDTRPLVYASLGTTRKCEPAVFHWIAEACDGLHVQLVISLGGRRNPDAFAQLRGDPIVVKAAPQLALLARADAVITHAGSNTAFEALMHGKPMVAIPRAFDQPAIAARLARHNAAIVLPYGKASAQRLRMALKQVLEDDSYRKAAVNMRAMLQRQRGLECAADHMEAALGRCRQAVAAQ